ncbi:ankyrin repeat domain-containing protein [Candidatus Babeliales bacterium]|nr:ankyrin repeat domain-containing protein [Candidatus Babeliales bacterium]MCF7899457.1 ankyrin repeat domain-containing protein [Candidatus Babeliales bacterium]
MRKIQKILFFILLFINSNIFADKKAFQENKFETFKEIITNLPEDIFKCCILEKYNNDLTTLCRLIQGLLPCHEPKYQSFVFSALEKINSLDKDINSNSQTTFYDILNAATQCLLENKRSFQWKRFWRLWPSEFSQIYNKDLCFNHKNNNCLFCNILKMRELYDKKYVSSFSTCQTINNTFFKAIQEENFNLARMLLKHGADIKMQDQHRLTPLYRATQDKNLKSIKFLLQNGANMHLDPITEQKYLDLLCDLKDNSICKLFLKHGITNYSIWIK